MLDRLISLLQLGLLTSIAVVSLGGRSPDEPFDHGHAALGAVLDKVLDDGLVDYAGLRRSPDGLDAYLAALVKVTPRELEGWSRAERFAFWINAYNAFTLQLVRDEGPVTSIKKIGGWFGSPWKKRFIPMDGFDPKGKRRQLCLDDIEHGILRPKFADARLHAAVNCASLGCPPLRAEPYRGTDLDQQLSDQVHAWLVDPDRNDLKPLKGAIRVSKIFDWFEDDFGGGDEEVVRWIATQLQDADLAGVLGRAASTLRVRYLAYDWALNAQPKRR